MWCASNLISASLPATSRRQILERLRRIYTEHLHEPTCINDYSSLYFV